MDTDAPAAPAAAAVNGGPPPAPELSPEMKDKLTKLRDILSGKTPIALNLEFLYMHNKADLQVRRHQHVARAWDDTLCALGGRRAAAHVSFAPFLAMQLLGVQMAWHSHELKCIITFCIHAAGAHDRS